MTAAEQSPPPAPQAPEDAPKETTVMPTYVFPEITARATRKAKCGTCGKTVTRSRTFTQTESPFNKNPDGSVRTAREIRQIVDQQARDWQPENVTCRACEDAARGPDIPTALPTRPAVTGQVTTAAAMLVDLVARTGLPVRCAELNAHVGARYNAATQRVDLPGLPVVEVRVGGARELARWAQALDADTIKVDQGGGRTAMLRLAVDRDGITWRVHADYNARLTAKSNVEWATKRDGKRADYGSLSVAALAALPEQDQATPA